MDVTNRQMQRVIGANVKAARTKANLTQECLAEIAGIQGGKKTSELIPLCHPLQITKIDVNASLDSTGVTVTSEARCVGQTGIEMEAMTAVATGLLTVYDMCKAVDKGMVIDQVRLLKKTTENI